MTQFDSSFAAATGPAFALLDDCDASQHNPSSRLYTGWQASLVCTQPTDLAVWQAQLHRALEAGLHAVLVADYEWGLSLQGLDLPPVSAMAKRDASATLHQHQVPACLRVELFESLQRLDQAAVRAWLDGQVQSLAWPEAGLVGWQSSVDQSQFEHSIAAVHAAIEAGDSYQVNYTFAFNGRSYGSPLALFRTLRQRQPAQYGALIRLPAQAHQQQWILSHSPELFLKVCDGDITARPMKGTAPVQPSQAQTDAMAQWLHTDPKNRAENVMIVDLLRNDLGAVAQVGSVKVSDLFAVQTNGQVLGMTSTVEARLRPDADLVAVLSATFPCGSITGAPKRKTMELIAQIEGAPYPAGQEHVGPSAAPQPLQSSTPTHTVAHCRGVYTGAIGWIDLAAARRQSGLDAGAAASLPKRSPARALNYCFSVPIRTLLMDVEMPVQAGLAKPELGHAVQFSVGAGIVWDSKASEEWLECQLKAGFAVMGMAGFELFETMRVPAGAAWPTWWDWHLERLLGSAQTLGFKHDHQACCEQMQAYLQQHRAPDSMHDLRLRMALRSDGQLAFTHGLLAPVPVDQDGCVGLVLADAICHTPAWLRQHKTTLRSDYDAALQAAQAQGAFDCLFFNDQGFLTEGARSNVFVKLEADPDAPWYTPALAEGALPGVMRRVLLVRDDWHVQERRLSRSEVLSAHALIVCNALRGALPARLLRS